MSGRRVCTQHDRIFPPREIHPFIFFPLRFGQSDYGKVGLSKFFESGPSESQLAQASVDDNQIRASEILHPAVSSRDDLLHARKVIRALNGGDPEPAVV